MKPPLPTVADHVAVDYLVGQIIKIVKKKIHQNYKYIYIYPHKKIHKK